jgi:hypothetical protein
MNYFPTKNIEYLEKFDSSKSLTETKDIVEGFENSNDDPTFDNIQFPLGEILYENIRFDKGDLEGVDGINRNP